MDLQIFNIIEDNDICYLTVSKDLIDLILDDLNEISKMPIVIKDNILKIYSSKKIILDVLDKLINEYITDISNIKMQE